MTAFICNKCGTQSSTNPNSRMGWYEIHTAGDDVGWHFCSRACLKEWA